MVARAALGVSLAALLIAANTSAVRAGEDDEDGASVMSRIMHTFGLKNQDESVMGRGDNYSERSPLVVPPTRNLPPPVSNTAPPAPNWPKDPDIARSAKAGKVDNTARYQTDRVLDEGRPLRPDELGQKSSSSNPNDGDYTADSHLSDPQDRGVKKGLFSSVGSIFKKEEYATFTGEPPRASLTDPPPGYLTPSANEPYGVGPAKAQYHVPTIADHGEPQR
jgi:hypothetical protein